MKVIFHGDDFGLTSGVNKGIIRSFREGLLTSASLIAGGEAAEEAISLAKDNPGLDMGVHLILCDELPVLRPEHLSSIILSGSRFPSRNHVLKAILAHKIDYVEIEAEWNAQVEKVLNVEIPISHLDSHQFIHLFPGLLRICLNIAGKHKIPFVRASCIDLPTLDAGFTRFVQWSCLKLWIRLFVSRFIPPDIKGSVSVGFLGAGGRMNKDTLLKTIDTLWRKKSACVVEVVLHPGIGDGHTAHKYSHWRYDWKKDLDLLTDNSLKKALDLRGVELTSFGKEL